MQGLRFGTDGIRNKVGTGVLTQDQIISCGHAIARWAKDKYGSRPHLLMVQDTRNSSDWIKSCLKSSFFLHNIQVTDAQVLPTPALCAFLRYTNNFNFGIVISASHNPYYDNGLKIIDAKNGKLSFFDEQTISNYFAAPESVSYTQFGNEQFKPLLADEYGELLCSFFKPNFLKGYKIIIDCANGATYKVAPHIFTQLGGVVITINHHPDGTNINDNCGATAVNQLQKTVIGEHADFGFAFDGDGDRIIAINRSGDIKDGDDILALLAQHQHYKNHESIIGTVMSNKGLEHHLVKQGKKLIRSSVGDKHVVEAMKTHGAIIGSEPSGHVICGDYLNSGDGIFSALRIIEVAEETNNVNLNTFDKFPHFLVTVSVNEKKELDAPPLIDIIKEYNQRLGEGRLLVRYSGTEPLLRIMVEHSNEKLAKSLIESLQKIFSTELS